MGRPRPHTCHVPSCHVSVPRQMLMCKHHWYMVPKALRDRVWATYENGQEAGLATPSEAWHEAANEAIEAVLEKEALTDFAKGSER